MIITITQINGAAAQIAAPPDIVWSGTVGDFADDPVRGLKSDSPLETAIVIALFTDAPADEAALRYEHAGDFRGFPGDGIDGEATGSTLWIYRRRELSDIVAMEVKAEIERALSGLIDQQAVAKIVVSTAADKPAGKIAASIDIFARDGSTTYAKKFDLIWRGR